MADRILIDNAPTSLSFGKQGESGVTEYEFDCSAWLAENPAGEISVTFVAPNSTTVYTVPAEQAVVANGILTLKVYHNMTAEHGSGSINIRMIDGDDFELHSVVIEATITKSHYVPSGDPTGFLTSSKVLTTEGDLLTYTTEPARVGIGAAGSILKSTGTAPQWLAVGTSGQVLGSNGTAPTWVTPSVGRYVAVPANGTAPGTIGDWAADADFIYACYATDTWVRCAKTAW